MKDLGGKMKLSKRQKNALIELSDRADIGKLWESGDGVCTLGIARHLKVLGLARVKEDRGSKEFFIKLTQRGEEVALGLGGSDA